MRRGEWTGPTAFRVTGYVQCNLVILPEAEAYDFLLFCQRNPKACPLVEVTDCGVPEPRLSAPGAELPSPHVGDPVVDVPRGVMPVFWACGVTPQQTALLTKPELMITHAPGHGFVTDLKAGQFCLP